MTLPPLPAPWDSILMGVFVLAAIVVLGVMIYRTTYINDDWSDL